MRVYGERSRSEHKINKELNKLISTHKALEIVLNKSQDFGVEESDVFDGMNIKMNWLDPNSDVGKFVHDWAPGATRNVHGHLGRMKVKNVWEVEQPKQLTNFIKRQEAIAKERWTTRDKPFHQPKRTDLELKDATRFSKSGTHLLFHGTRSVNVSNLNLI